MGVDPSGWEEMEQITYQKPNTTQWAGDTSFSSDYKEQPPTITSSTSSYQQLSSKYDYQLLDIYTTNTYNQSVSSCFTNDTYQSPNNYSPVSPATPSMYQCDVAEYQYKNNCFP